MNTILKALADDNLRVNPISFNDNSEYKKIANDLCTAAETLNSKLDENEKKLLNAFLDAKAEEEHFCETDRFIRGFKIGALLMLEVLTSVKELEDN